MSDTEGLCLVRSIAVGKAPG